MVWPGVDPINSYSPQTATSNSIHFNFHNGYKADENAKDFQQRQYAFAYAQYLNLHTPQRSASSLSSSNHPPSNIKKKEPKKVPEKEKTEEYRARRVKNNESAKRSREARRRKEEEKDQKIMSLEAHIRFLAQENHQLREQLHLRVACAIPNPVPTNQFYSS
uniref:BZIP domain-containing protein n=1 Tax=Panagrolaimus sp. PS1159 TaxID=55785 RepID=A0AC35GI91_9BILA